MISLNILQDWIAEIIVFLLFATIIDLIIPNNSYRKYTTLVIGLVLLLIFLKPIFYIFNFDVEKDLEVAFSSILEESETENINKNNRNSIEIEIQRGQDAYILKHMTDELINIAKYPLIDAHQVEITNIEYIFENDIKSYETLVEMIIYLTEYKGEGRIVKEVKEIVIKDRKEVESSREDEEEIISLLKELWELQEISVTIEWEGS